MEFEVDIHGEPFPKPGRFLGDRSIAREPNQETVQQAQTLAESSYNPKMTAAKLLDPYRLDHTLPIDHLAGGEQPQHIFMAITDSSYFLISDTRVLNMGGGSSLTSLVNPNEMELEEVTKRLEEITNKDLVQAVAFNDLLDFAANSGMASLKFKYSVAGESEQYSYSADPNYHDEEELFAAEKHVTDKMATAPIQFSNNSMNEPQNPVSKEPSATDDPLEEIDRLAQLREAGSLSEAEFKAKKEEILENL